MRAPMFRELFLDPLRESRRAGVRVGDLVVAPFLEGAPSASGGAAATRAQLEGVLATMDLVLDAAGAMRSEVIRVTFFLRDVLERPILNSVWEEAFPDPAARPPHKYVPARLLGEGVRVAIGVLALVGASAQVLTIPDVAHVDPMSMGQRSGNVVTSSRLFAAEDDVETQLTRLLERARLLLSAAGGELSDLTQATFFVGTPEIAEAVDARWQAGWSPSEEPPVLHVIEADLGGGNGLPRVEILGLL
jgi:enamine deaminase RidA (YjgF/YER057c/UK114 family)